MNDPYKPLHARPLVPVEAPQLISVVAFRVDHDRSGSPDDTAGRNEASVPTATIETFIKELYAAHDATPPEPDPGATLYDAFALQQMIENRGRRCVMQKHTNFFSVLVFADTIDPPQTWGWGAIPAGLDKRFLNKAVFKTHIRVEQAVHREKNYEYNILETFNADVPEQDAAQLSDMYAEIYASNVSDGGALAWTPFKCFSDGYNRILIRNISLGPQRLGRLVRRLVEINLYVALGIRNYDDAQKQLNDLAAEDKRLSQIVFDRIRESHSNEDFYADMDRQNYKNIIEIAKNVSKIVSETRYRFEETLAYSELVSRRIYELREQRLEGWTRIGFFMERNYTPCVKTCETALRYQAALSQRIQEQASLLSAGLHFHVAEKSKEILEQQQKNQRSEIRFRVTIEIIALSAIVYYGSYVMDKVFFDRESSWMISSSIIIVFIGVFLFTRRGKSLSERLSRALDLSEPRSK
jgi:uncharacterized membrane-anchored protein